MRTVSALLLAIAYLGMLRAAWADEANAAKAVLSEAVRAHGGQERLAKTQLMTRQAKGVISLFGQDLPFTDELVVQLPERWRLTIEAGAPGEKMRLLMVVNGDKGWHSIGGAVMELSKERLAELREEAYVIWLSSLVPLLKDSGFALAPLPEAKVNGQPAAGVKVSHKGHEDVKLYFDKQSRLLVKIERRAKEAGLAIDKEYLYSGHKRIEGVQVPTRYVELADGKKFVEVSEISYKFLRSVDDSTFAKP